MVEAHTAPTVIEMCSHERDKCFVALLGTHTRYTPSYDIRQVIIRAFPE